MQQTRKGYYRLRCHSSLVPRYMSQRPFWISNDKEYECYADLCDSLTRETGDRHIMEPWNELMKAPEPMPGPAEHEPEPVKPSVKPTPDAWDIKSCCPACEYSK